MFTIKTNCPVPFDQQPLNEYLLLKRSWLFAWSVSSRKYFVYSILSLFLLLGPLANIFLKILLPIYDFYHNLLMNLYISNFIIFLLSVRIYLGWSYIVKRLLSATVFYEESGWYDGQIWVKTSDYLMQDRLVGLYQVMPFIIRVKYTFFFTIINFFSLYFLQFLLDKYNYILYSN
uniref:Ycf36 n=1 Tax=Polysiphonia infestans TaxID=2006978 RepID=A0A1Z1MEV2_9FLOR|nr:hypothetical protein [Polysiphonia infestans]ARW64382.1 hypothetical protein [Polysiphonia infestans]